MKVRELISLLQQQDQEAMAVVCGMDGAGYCAVAEIEKRRLVRVESCCGDFGDEGGVFEPLGFPCDAVYIS